MNKVNVVWQSEKGFVTDQFGKEMDIVDLKTGKVIEKLPRYAT